MALEEHPKQTVEKMRFLTLFRNFREDARRAAMLEWRWKFGLEARWEILVHRVVCFRGEFDFEVGECLFTKPLRN